MMITQSQIDKVMSVTTWPKGMRPIVSIWYDEDGDAWAEAQYQDWSITVSDATAEYALARAIDGYCKLLDLDPSHAPRLEN